MTNYIFKEVDASNLWEVVALSVNDDQTNFVATNTKSLLQAAYQFPVAQPFGMYADETLIGFILTY